MKPVVVIQLRAPEQDLRAEIDAARARLHMDFEDAQSKGERGVQGSDALRAQFLTEPRQRIHREVQAAMHRDGLVFDFASRAHARSLFGMDRSWRGDPAQAAERGGQY